MQDLYRQIYADPNFHELEKKRGRFSWLLTSIMLVTYFSFILIIAFSPELFAIPIIEGHVITWGIVSALFVILFSFSLTGIYVHRTNKIFDKQIKSIVDQVRNSDDA
jgi:uncharacterized membrane protein (DUF485 family)